MNHSVKRRRQALHQTYHHYYLNISVQAGKFIRLANRIEKIDSVARIESNRIETFCPNWNALLDWPPIRFDSILANESIFSIRFDSAI